MGISDVFVPEILHPAEEPHGAKDLLLEYSCLKMANDLQIFHAVNIAQIAGGLIVPEWGDDLKVGHAVREE
jgi:hypothetical protein